MEWSLNPFDTIGNYFQSMWNTLGGYGFKTDEELKKERESQRQAERENLLNMNQEFKDLFDSGATSEDLIKYVMDNPEWSQQNSAGIESLIGEKLQAESYGKNLQAMKNAGINPLVGLGNVGSLGDGVGYSMDQQVQHANKGNDLNSGLSTIKNLLMILLALGRL